MPEDDKSKIWTGSCYRKVFEFSAMKGGYGEFCPIAKASEVFATRWTPLVLRELMLGAHSFNDIHRGVPLMSLAERLRQLEENGIVARRIHPDNSACEYWLTQSGEAFHDVLRDLSRWGLAHARDRLTADDLNPGLLMWRMRKRVDIGALPERRVVIRFEFSGVPRSRTALRVIWLVLERTGVDICFKDPGYNVDLTVRSDVAILVRLYLGHVNWQEVAGKALSIGGDRRMARQLPIWLQLHRQLGRDYLPFGRPAA